MDTPTIHIIYRGRSTCLCGLDPLAFSINEEGVIKNDPLCVQADSIYALHNLIVGATHHYKGLGLCPECLSERNVAITMLEDCNDSR